MINKSIFFHSIFFADILADINNWMIQKEDIPVKINDKTLDPDGGSGGFMPYGVAGIMAGAAQCFYGIIAILSC